MRTTLFFEYKSRPWELRWLMVGAVAVLTGISVAPELSRAVSKGWDAASARVEAAPVPEDELALALGAISPAGAGSGAGTKTHPSSGPRATTADPFHLLSRGQEESQSDAADRDRGAAAKEAAPRARASGHRGRLHPVKKAKPSAPRARGPVFEPKTGFPQMVLMGMGDALLSPENPLRADEAAHPPPHFVPPDDPNPTKKPTDPGVKLPEVVTDAITAGGVPIYRPDKERRDVGVVVRPAWPFGVTVAGKFY